MWPGLKVPIYLSIYIYINIKYIYIHIHTHILPLICNLDMDGKKELGEKDHANYTLSAKSTLPAGDYT